MGPYVIDVQDAKRSNLPSQQLVGQVIQRIQIFRGPAFNSRYEGIPRENVLHLSMQSGIEVYLTYRFLEPYHDVFVIVTSLLTEVELFQFRDAMERSVLLQAIE
jgi:hypothetical protein